MTEKHLATTIVSAGAIFVVTAAAFVPWKGVKAEPLPQIAEPQQNFERPKTPAINQALDKRLGALSKAQAELRTLYTEGRVKRFLGIQGMWQAHIESTQNEEYYMVFESKTGPMLGFGKRVYTDKSRQHESRDLGYEINYYSDGNVKDYTRRTLRDGMSFYPHGRLESFSAEIDERTSYSASWNDDGKLRGEAASLHPPRNEKGLSEWENALRHGDFQTRSEAAGEMARIGPASIPYALSVLKDGDDGAREQAATVFILMKEGAAPSVPDLVRCLREDKSARVRTSIARSLGLIGPAAGSAIPALEEAATNANPDVAKAAKSALDHIQQLPAKQAP